MRFNDLFITKWQARFRGKTYSVSIGRGGIDEKRGEGDQISPIGVWRVEEWLYRPDRLRSEFKPLRLSDGWSDDPQQTQYNQLVKLPYGPSHERLFRPDHLYDLVAVLDYNRSPVIAGKGSAIFLHAWRRPRYPTEGCIAFAPQDLREIAANWDPNARVIIQ